MGLGANRLRVKEAPEKGLRDRSLQPGHLSIYTWAAQLEEPFLNCPQPGWPADMVAEEVGLGSGCLQTGLDFDISSAVGIGPIQDLGGNHPTVTYPGVFLDLGPRA